MGIKSIWLDKEIDESKLNEIAKKQKKSVSKLVSSLLKENYNLFKDKKAQTTFYGLMLGIVIFVLALALAPPVAEFTNNVRNETGEFGGLNCTGTDNNFIKATCIVADLNLFYFIGILVFMAGIVVTAKYFFGGVGGESFE
jgi:hypothetical protein